MAIPQNYRLYGADAGAFAALITSSSTPQAVQSNPGSVFQVSDSPGGTVITDLYDPTSTSAETVVTADGQGFVSFYAPPGLGTLWLRQVISGTPTGGYTPVWPADVADLLENVMTTLAGLGGSGGSGGSSTPTQDSLVVGLDGKQAVGSLLPNGYMMDRDASFVGIQAQLNVSPQGSPLTARVRVRRRSSGTVDVLGIVTLDTSERRDVLTFQSPATLLVGDVIFVDVTAVGSTYAGRDLQVTLLASGRSLPAVAAAPAGFGVPTAITATPGSSKIDLAWTNASGTAGVHIFRDGSYLATVEGGTTYSDTSVVTGTSYGYVLQAYSDDVSSVLSGSVSATASSGFFYDFTQADGALPSSDWTVATGGAAAALADVNSNRMRLQSGATGGNVAADTATVTWVKSTTAKTGWAITATFTLSNTASAFQFFVSTDSGETVYYRLQISSSAWTLGKRVGGAFSTIATGSFTFTAGTAFKVDYSVSPAGDIVLYLWNASAAKPATPTYTTAGTPDPSRASIPAGGFHIKMLGGTSAQSNQAYIDDMTVVPS